MKTDGDKTQGTFIYLLVAQCALIYNMQKVSFINFVTLLTFLKSQMERIRFTQTYNYNKGYFQKL
jgi:hypothetical protein